MNRLALIALLIGIGVGCALMASPWALPLTRLVGALSLTGLLALAALLVLTVLHRLPERLVGVIASLALLYGLRALYLVAFHHWATPGLFVLGGLVVLTALWGVPLRLPYLRGHQRARLAALCGMATAVQWNAFAPRDLLHGVQRWKQEPLTRTPLGIASHGGLLLSLGLFPLLGFAAISSRSGSDGTAPP